MPPDDFDLEMQTSADLAMAAEADRVSDALWPATLAQMVEVTCAALERSGMDEKGAESLSRVVVLAQAHYIGGRSLYLPRGKVLEAALRDLEIYRASRRGNTEALARKYGLTDRAVQKIVRKQTLLRRDRLQPRLPLR